jgi:ABC-type sulfate transport system permease component
LIITAAATILGIKRGVSLWGIDLLLFTVAGLSGCILTFLATLSEHPAVIPNYLLFVFHPLHLIFLPAMIHSEIKHKTSMYHAFNIVVLTLFIVLYPVIPQRFDLAVVPLALCLWIRSLSNLTLTHKRTE